MRIVGICACPSGLVHGPRAKEALVDAAKQLGHRIHLELQSAVDVEDTLDDRDIWEAEVVILAVDGPVRGVERFRGKRMVKISCGRAAMAPRQILIRLEEMLQEAWAEEAEESERRWKRRQVWNARMQHR